MNIQQWRDRAKCKNQDPNFFFPSVEDVKNSEFQNVDQIERHRKMYCLGIDDGNVCPVRRECLDYAIANNLDGIWGGTTENEREKIKIKRKRTRSKVA